MNLHSKTSKIIYVACVTIFFSCLGGWAVLAYQDDTAGIAGPDAQFAKKAAQGGMAEVKLGQLAQEKGSSEAVKEFGKKMVAEHSKAGEELKEVARKEKITLPNDVDAKDQAIYENLAKLSGAEFDRAYARDMVTDHKKDLAEFQREANTGKDQGVKSFAAQTVPMIQHHLNEAQNLLKNGSATNMTGTPVKRRMHAPGAGR